MIQTKTFEELENTKFDVIERIGIVKHQGRLKIFIMEAVPPTRYGADCQNYIWHEVWLKTRSDFTRIKVHLEKLFQVRLNELNKENCIQSVRLLNDKLKSKAKIVDWGACHVVHLPFSRQFAN